MQQVQAELANAYAQEFFTVRLPPRLPRAQILRAFRLRARHLAPSQSQRPEPIKTRPNQGNSPGYNVLTYYYSDLYTQHLLHLTLC